MGYHLLKGTKEEETMVAPPLLLPRKEGCTIMPNEDGN